MNRILEQDIAAIYLKLSARERFADSRILLTGCAGFLGYTFLHFFCHYSRELGIKSVLGIDNFLLDKPVWIEDLQKNWPQLLTVAHCDIVNDNLSLVPDVEQADYILHMASIASPTYYRKYPIETLDANVWGLRRLLEACRGRHIRKFLFFSSSEIYGDPDVHCIPTEEEYRGNVSAIGPRSCYDEAKRFGETLCYTFAHQYNVPVVIVRPFNNYGPGMRLADKRVPADFTRAVLENRDIVMYSDGTPTRTFCYISDAIIGYLLALTSDESFNYFNIGIDRPEISIRELADIYIRQGQAITGYTGSAQFQPPPEKDYLTHNPSRRCPDIRKARSLLGYAPDIFVNEGVGRMIMFFQENKGSL